MNIIANPHPQVTQRRILSNGNIGRQLMDHQRAATYIPAQKTRGKAKNADQNPIQAALEGAMLMALFSVGRMAYSISCRSPAILLKICLSEVIGVIAMPNNL